MSDGGEIDVVKLITHAGTGVGGGGLVAFMMRVFQSRESQAVATELALLRSDVNAMAKTLEKHSDLAERVALLERDVKAVHDRLDGKRGGKR